VARGGVPRRFAGRGIGHALTVTASQTPARPRVAVFDPTPVLTIVVESLAGQPDIHLHAGGQGVWVTRMLLELGVEAVLCAPIGGETGVVLSVLARHEGIDLRAVPSPGSCGAYIDDRRSGKREEFVTQPATPLGRHVLDELYGLFLGESAGAAAAVLTGPREPGAVPADTYRRLSSDCRQLGTTTVADLSGDALAAALAGGLTVLKVGDDELQDHGRLEVDATADHLVAAARLLHDDGAENVVISRGERPALVLVDGQLSWTHGPRLDPADHRGAGDSMTAGIAAGVALGMPLRDAVRLGVAAGVVTVSRHGLATGDAQPIGSLLSTVSLQDRPIGDDRQAEQIVLDGVDPQSNEGDRAHAGTRDKR